MEKCSKTLVIAAQRKESFADEDKRPPFLEFFLEEQSYASLRGCIHDRLKPLKRARIEVLNEPSTFTQKKHCFAAEDGRSSPCLGQSTASFAAISALPPLKQDRIDVEGQQSVPNSTTKKDHGHMQSNASFSAMKGSLEGDQPSLGARLQQALQEQEQTYLRIVEEKHLQVGQMETQLFLAQQNLAEAEAQLTSFRDRNSWISYHGNAFASLSGSEGENNQEEGCLNDNIVSSDLVGVAPSSMQNGRFTRGTREPPTNTNTYGDKSRKPTSFSDPIVVHEGANPLAANSSGVSEGARTKEKASRAGTNMVSKFKHSRKGKSMHLLSRYQDQRMKFDLCVTPLHFRHVVRKISNQMIKGLKWTNSALDCLHISTEDYLGFAILQEDIHVLMSARWNWFHSASFMKGDLTLPPKTRLTKRVRIFMKNNSTKQKHEEFS